MPPISFLMHVANIFRSLICEMVMFFYSCLRSSILPVRMGANICTECIHATQEDSWPGYIPVFCIGILMGKVVLNNWNSGFQYRTCQGKGRQTRWRVLKEACAAGLFHPPKQVVAGSAARWLNICHQLGLQGWENKKDETTKSPITSDATETHNCASVGIGHSRSGVCLK